jgi:phosphatidylserine/phosphatidylglycerophosphate/cardiolipin synthase-like enzyme
MIELHGEIKSPLSIPETFDFSTRKIDLGWIPRTLTRESHILDNNHILRTSKRQFIIPSKEGELVKILIDRIKHAQKMVCISSYMIQQGDLTDALLEVSQRGVHVFLLTAKADDLTHANFEIFNEDNINKTQKDERIKDLKNLFDQFAGNVLIRTFNGFHAKYCLIDPIFPNSFGIMMTCNANVDPMMGNGNIDIAMTLTDEEIASFFSHFLHGFWQMADAEKLTKGNELDPLDPIKNPPTFDISYGEITLPVTTQNLFTLRDKIIQLIQKSQKSITISAWSFDKDYIIEKALLDSLSRDVDIKIFCRTNKLNTQSLRELLHRGAQVFGHDRFHAKCLIVDNREGIITTSNYTSLGLDKGFETSVLFNENEMPEVEQLLDYWESKCSWELKEDIELKEVKDRIRLDNEGEDDLKDIPVEETGSYTNPNSKTKVDSCEKLLEPHLYEESALKIAFNLQKKIIKKLRYAEKIEIPTLPAHIGKERIRNNFRIHKGGKNLEYLVVDTWEEVRLAANLDFVKAAKGKIKIVWKEPEKTSRNDSKTKNP